MSLGHFHYTVLFNGLILPGVSVTVYLTGTTTRVALYEDSGGVTPLANPLTNDATFGTVDFFVAAGVYDLVFAKVGYTFPPLDEITIGLPGKLVASVEVPSVNGAALLTASGAIPAKAGDVEVFVLNEIAFGTGGGLTGYAVGDGTTSDFWGTAIPPTLNNQTTRADFRGQPGPIYPTGGDVVLSALGGTFAATGKALVEVHYTLETPVV